jgi:hypothetical protein
MEGLEGPTRQRSKRTLYGTGVASIALTILSFASDAGARRAENQSHGAPGQKSNADRRRRFLEGVPRQNVIGGRCRESLSSEGELPARTGPAVAFERAQVNSAGHGSPVYRCRVHACISSTGTKATSQLSQAQLREVEHAP